MVRINRLGQATMEIFKCPNHRITIKKYSPLGIVERISDEDKVGELNVNEMTVNIQKQQLPPAKPLTKEKHQYIFGVCHAQCAGHDQAEVLGSVVKTS